jgi:hypothetical protein
MLFLLRSNPHVTVDMPEGASALPPEAEPAFHEANRQLALCLRFINVVLAHAAARTSVPRGVMMVSRTLPLLGSGW